MEVREQDQPLTQERIFGRERLLDLEQQLSVAPDALGRAERGADGTVGLVGERAAFAGPRLDEHVVTALHELAGTGRRERDPVLVGLDLLDDSDLHEGEKP